MLRKSVTKNSDSGSKHSTVRLDPVDPNDAMILYFEDRKKRDGAYKEARVIFGSLLEEVKKIDAGNVPSLMVFPKNGYYLNIDRIYRRNNAKIIYFPSARHSQLGILALWRKKHPESKYMGIVNNVDLVPTLLSHLGLPLPSYTDGKSIINEVVEFTDYRPRWQLSKRLSHIRARLK